MNKFENSNWIRQNDMTTISNAAKLMTSEIIALLPKYGLEIFLMSKIKENPMIIGINIKNFFIFLLSDETV
jgi:hypothetical protein